MKNILTVCVLVSLLGFNGIAQDSLKFANGEWSTEVNINPLNGEIALNNVINQIKIRHISKSGKVHRFALTANSINRMAEMKEPYGYNSIDQEARQNTLLLGFNYGLEKHFKGTKRLSPYIGGELAFAVKRSYQKTEDNLSNENNTKVNGAWLSSEYYYTQYGYSIMYYYVERGFSSVGLNMVLGFDYYISNKLFVGFEFLVGINYLKYQKLSIDDEYISIPDTKENEFLFGPKILNGIRIGYVFN